MIFGKTYEQQDKEEETRLNNLVGDYLRGVVKFAWLPTVLDDGRSIWLSRYVVRLLPEGGKGSYRDKVESYLHYKCRLGMTVYPYKQHHNKEETK